MFTLGYNTNGLAHHRLDEAMVLLAELGYGALALTPDVGQLDPFRVSDAEIARVAGLARELGLRIVVETGARFLMDPRRKHFPTLLEDEVADRQRRVDFYRRSIDLGVALGAEVVSIWSGAAPDGLTAEKDPAGESAHWDRLCQGLEPVLGHANGAGMTLAFEPEPGMFIERPKEYEALLERLGTPGEALWLTLDVGHLVVTGDLPVGDAIRASSTRIRNVHLDDCPRGVHLHGPFGSGDLDLQDAVSALIEIDYEGVASVELSRDSHRGAQAAQQAIRELRKAIEARP